MIRDGWFSQWTTGTTGHELRFDRSASLTGTGERDHPTVTVEVQAQEDAEIELTFYEFVLEDDVGG